MLATNVMKSPGTAMEIGSNIGSPAKSRNPQTASSSIPDVTDFYHNGKQFHLGKIVRVASKSIQGFSDD